MQLSSSTIIPLESWHWRNSPDKSQQCFALTHVPYWPLNRSEHDIYRPCPPEISPDLYLGANHWGTWHYVAHGMMILTWPCALNETSVGVRNVPCMLAKLRFWVLQNIVYCKYLFIVLDFTCILCTQRSFLFYISHQSRLCLYHSAPDAFPYNGFHHGVRCFGGRNNAFLYFNAKEIILTGPQMQMWSKF